MFEGMSERFQNFLLFAPVYQLQNIKHPVYKELDMMELGFGVLIFMMDQMLSGKGNVTNEELNTFLQKMLSEYYNLEYDREEINALRVFLVDEKLRNDGKDFIYEYRDFETNEKKVMNFKLIDNDNWSYANFSKQEVRLRLSEKGIEFLFKTKEIYSEMQISITMLYFKQQLSKGAYGQVLSISKDLLFQIKSRIRALGEYEDQLKRNVMSVFNRKKLEERLQRSYDQMDEEKKQIHELQMNIERVKQNYLNGSLTEKEIKRYETILEIDKMLMQSRTQHEKMFRKTFELIGTTNTAIQALIENAFSKRFNFEQEILQNWVEKKVDMDKAGAILKPVMPLRTPKIYSPLEAFTPQLMRKVKREDSLEKAESIDLEEAEQQRIDQRHQEEFEYEQTKELIKMILFPLLKKDQYFISDVLTSFRNDSPEEYELFEKEEKLAFLQASIMLHQCKHRKFEWISAEELAFDDKIVKLLCEITRENEDLLDIEEFEMFATERMYEFLDGTVITDYIIKRKG